MSDSEDPIDPIDEGGDDLFGDEGDDDIASNKERVLDDDDLASDPEGNGYSYSNRNEDGDQTQHETRDRVIMAVQTYRHRVPKPKDGALRVMRVPKFIRVMPQEYDPEHFEPSEFDIANARAEHPKHVARVRRDHETGELRSNTNIYRWSDGSVTISIGGEQYEIQKKALALSPDKPYSELHDGHYYAAAAELNSNLLMTVGHITEQYNVRPNKAGGDDALTRLAERMAQASKPAVDGDMIIKNTRDPELQKKQAELAEKERMKAQRRRENAAAKMDGSMGRSSRGGHLSIGGLESGQRYGGKKRGAPGSKRPARRNDEYDSDDDLPQGTRRQDSYDLEDDFVVRSDEEEEAESGADDDDDDDILDDEDERPRKKRQRTVDEDEDAEGDDIEPMKTSGRARRRNVIDDDDE